MSQQGFQDALAALVNDPEYREKVVADQTTLVKDFDLTPGEVGLLSAVGEAAGGIPDVQGYELSTTEADAIDVIIICCCCCP